MRNAALAVAGIVGLVGVAAAGATKTYLDSRAEILTLQQAIAASWQQADAAIQKRAELAPALVQTIRPYATRERAIGARVLAAREALGASFVVAKRIEAGDELAAALQNLLEVAESYPELLSTPGYRRLQDELAAVENEIAAQRRKYNQQVQEYNTKLQLFPANFVAAMEGFQRQEAYFRTNERARQSPPAVPFTEPKAPAEDSLDEPPSPDAESQGEEPLGVQ